MGAAASVDEAPSKPIVLKALPRVPGVVSAALGVVLTVPLATP